MHVHMYACTLRARRYLERKMWRQKGRVIVYDYRSYTHLE